MLYHSGDEETVVTRIAHFDGVWVVVGIDTHKDQHVAVAIDGLGTRLGKHRLRSTTWSFSGFCCLRPGGAGGSSG